MTTCNSSFKHYKQVAINNQLYSAEIRRDDKTFSIYFVTCALDVSLLQSAFMFVYDPLYELHTVPVGFEQVAKPLEVVQQWSKDVHTRGKKHQKERHWSVLFLKRMFIIVYDSTFTQGGR